MSKLVISRWQWDEIVEILIRDMPGGVQNWMDERFKIRRSINPTADVPPLYVFFGFKQELVKWRLLHGIDAKETILARDWDKLQGRRARPVPVYDWGWMCNNDRHEITRRARAEIYQLEARYGSGPELYRTYGEGSKCR